MVRFLAVYDKPDDPEGFGRHYREVQEALDEQGIEFEVVKGPLRRSQRDALEELSGQRQYPVIELDDGTVYREESKDMAARILRGALIEGEVPVG